MSSLYYFRSSEPNNYGEVSASITPIVSQPVQVRVSGIQYQAHFSLTTKDDYIELETANEVKKYYMKEWGVYDINNIPLQFMDYTEKLMDIKISSTGVLVFTGKGARKIISATHRVKLLLGLYHTTFPIDITKQYFCESAPLTNFGNILYLKSNIPSIVGFGDKDKEEYRSIAYKGSDYLHPGIPVNSRTPGPIVITKSDNLTVLKFQLVDFMMEPVILHSPLFITFEVFYNIIPTPMIQPDMNMIQA